MNWRLLDKLSLSNKRVDCLMLSTGNEGVGQMVAKIFIRFCIAAVLISLPMALFCIEGCLERASGPSQGPSSALEDQMTNSGLQMDYDVELSSNMFRVKGDLIFAGNKQLPYVLVNATLGQGERAIVTTRYLMMQIEPERECSFEICKSCTLSAGEYDCALSVEDSEGVLAEDVRKVSLAQGQSGIGGWSEAEEVAFWRMIEENEREEDEGRGDFGEEEKSGVDASEEDEEREDAGEAKAGARVESDVMAEDESSGSAFDEEDLFVGSITSKKYHRPDCRYAQKIKPENLISFRSIDDARRQGYIPCKVCNP
jgi:hypothetical protein